MTEFTWGLLIVCVFAISLVGMGLWAIVKIGSMEVPKPKEHNHD